MGTLGKYEEKTFEDIKHFDDNGCEYWEARELMVALEYKRWDKFCNVIDNAKVSCEKSNNVVFDHFSQVGKMIEIAKGAKRKILDYKLSRYACYLIAQNRDSRKSVIALSQTHFAIQTRKQELLEKEYNSLTDDLPIPSKVLKELEKDKNKKENKVNQYIQNKLKYKT